MNEQTTIVDDPALTATSADVFGDDLPPDDKGGTDDKGTVVDDKAKTPTPTPALTPDQIRASVADGVRDAQPKPTTEQRQYTQDELDQMFNVWKPSEDLVTRVLGGGEDALKALTELRDGLSKQFGTLLQYQIELVKRELGEQFSPALSFTQERAAAQDREDFFSQHEDLKAHEELVQTVFNALKAEGYSAKDKAEAYKTLADRSRKLLGGNGATAGAAQSNGAKTTTTTQPGKRPASLSSGSQAGGGSGGSAPAGPFPGAEVFM